MEREIGIIRTELHCTDVSIHGSFVERLTAAGEHGAQQRLQVWLQPRLPDASSAETIDHLVEIARAAERIRVNGGGVSLNVGCELPLFMDGILNGNDFWERVQSLVAGFDAGNLDAMYEALNAHLAVATTAARSVFGGALIYSSAEFEWDGIDWSVLDYVGMNHYRDAANQATYVDQLRGMRRHGKPIIVTEFGCGAFEGADQAGSASWEIVDWEFSPPRLNGEYARSEETQATYLTELLDIFEEEAVRGAFVYTFIEENLHSDDPRYDLDMASFGVVKVVSLEAPAIANGTYWEPKQAFQALAERYAASERQSRRPERTSGDRCRWRRVGRTSDDGGDAGTGGSRDLH
jgi:hypothetical protein